MYPFLPIDTPASILDKIYFYIKLFLKWIRQRMCHQYIIADLRDNRILVQDVNVKGLQLWKEGFFGKGTLSRGAPTWALRKHLENQSESLYEYRNKSKIGDQYSANEEYILSSEEAFYLCTVDRLRIMTHESEYLTLKELWDYFSKGSDAGFDDFKELSPRFPIRFAVYNYYRKKKWVVRQGLKYGADFVLYEKGPSVDHSKYVVVIIPITNQNNYLTRNWTWVLRMSRLCSQVRKTLILCFVVLPKDFMPSDLLQIDILPKLIIWDIEISRWIPNISL